MRALILVDLQNDFLPGGAAPVPEGDAVIPLANRLQGEFDLVVATQEWHPAKHVSFAANHTGREPGEVLQLRKRKQLLGRPHCVQRTHGAEFAPRLMLNRVNKVFKKGTDTDIDSHSGFFDQGHERATGLGEYLREKKVTEVFVLGLATDGCVKFTALDAVSLGFQTRVIEDACRGRNLKPGDAQKAIDEMKAAGVMITDSAAVLRPGGSRPARAKAAK